MSLYGNVQCSIRWSTYFTLFFMGTVVRTLRKQVLQLRKLGLLQLRKLDGWALRRLVWLARPSHLIAGRA